MEGPGLSVSPELGLESDPGLTSRAPGLANDVLQLHGERPEDPGQDEAVHPEPGQRHGRAVGEDVVVEGVVLEGEKEKVPPASVGGEGGVQEDRHQGPDVLNAGGLGKEVGDDGGLVVGRRVGVGDRRRGNPKKNLGLHQLASQSVNGGALMLPGEGRGPLVRLSGGDGRSGGGEGGEEGRAGSIDVRSPERGRRDDGNVVGRHRDRSRGRGCGGRRGGQNQGRAAEALPWAHPPARGPRA